ncbi:MAG: Transglutaminase-like enzyme, partial [Myxococcaceae bacterium]|nr:Transglutaminase-like enzyme [Myxococcaceae bacterium]
VGPTLGQAPIADGAALSKAVEDFYRGATPEQLRQAVKAAQSAGPHSARFHEIAAELALLEGDDGATFDHLSAALLDTSDDAAQLHLHKLCALEWSFEQRTRAVALFGQLAEHHPDPQLRALASWQLAYLLNGDGDFTGRAQALARIPGTLDFAIVGTWDNDSGKGFDLELAPELRPGLDEKYVGRSHQMGWRLHPPNDSRGRLDLGALMSPSRWAVAFAQARVEAEQDGDYELRLTTSDPLKVWVDGKLAFSVSELERSVFDHLVVPLKLTRGPHRVLVKSAHRDDSWVLSARLVVAAKGQPPLANLAAKVIATPHSPPELDSARLHHHLVEWAHLGAGGSHTVRFADTFARAFPDSLAARLDQTEALWFNQERGRTADLLSLLDKDVGDALPFIRLRQVRFNQQQGMRHKARAVLLELTKAKPNVREGWELLAEYYRSESWTEDELKTLEQLQARFPISPSDRFDSARALQRHGRRAAAIAEYRQVLKAIPYHSESLKRLAELALEAGELDEAQAQLRKRLSAWPTDYPSWISLSEVRRRKLDSPGAHQALATAMALNPDASLAYQADGNLFWTDGQREQAIARWREALAHNPDDERLANRLDYVAPEAKGPWAADVPDESALEAAVALRTKVKPRPGADVAYLLDHEVTQLNSDGSSINVVTMVMHAFNPAGRDRLVRQNVSGAGRVRMLASYSVDEKGARTEAASERGRSVLFRGLQPGSTVVMQYRVDSPPAGYLSRYLTKSWSFQGVGDQRVFSQFVMWVPAGTELHERKVGTVEREESKHDNQLRLQWTSTDVPPLIPEPGMPTVAELAANIKLSTVPDWSVWLSWEQALLDGAFRDSPETDAVARQLGQGNPDEKTRFNRIHEYVMQEIRYQQDYESFIAGVKPHPAPMTLERKYGDCKDKAVLFITLARKLGLDAHFALVRTRDAGPVDQDVPMQQFNHAIVYVPEQKGFPSARFFDPTADALDLAAVRSDDTGTRALVFDPKNNVHTWREIPFQAPELNSDSFDLKLSLDAQGGAAGTITMSGVGRTGSVLRRTARNAETTAQFLQRVSGALLPGSASSEAKVVEVKSLTAPAVLQTKVFSAAFARKEGDTFRVRIPSDWSPRQSYNLATRRHPLVLGSPTQYVTRTELALPDGMQVKKLPQAGGVDSPCLSYQRSVKLAPDGKSVEVKQEVKVKCERISSAEYQEYRGRAEEIARILEDELVLGGVGKTTARAQAK